MADFGAADQDAFRKEVRDWVEANFPASLKGKPNPMMREERANPTPDQDAWRKAVGAKGWGTPTWPAEYGGSASPRPRAASSSRNSAAPAPTTRSAAWA